MLLFTALLLAAFGVLPIHFSAPPPNFGHPAVWLLAQLAQRLLLPFIALSAAAPLLQHWLARTEARDPYVLYAASNAGSLGALLAYPFAIEPIWPLHTQAAIWLGLYIGVTLLLITTGWMIRNSRPPFTEDAAATQGLTLRTQSHWVILALLPSSLLMAVTSFITSDLAPIPLLWVIPLALYLVTYIIAFGRLARGVPYWLERAAVILLIAWAAIYRAGATAPLAAIIVVHLLLFFVLALACHSRLVASRPPAFYLTRFYLVIALGGALGGAFNALVAPVLFESYLEYPLAILCAFVLLHERSKSGLEASDFILLAVFVIIVISVFGAPDVQRNPLVARLVTIGIPALFAYILSSRPIRYAVAIGILLLTVRWDPRLHARVIETQRNFFGVLRITADPTGRYYELRHGTTLHGAAEKGWRQGSEPLTYYSERSPVADLLRMGQARASFSSVGIVGLGVGSLAWYARPTEQWTFFELNPAVEVIARDPGLFGFLEKTRAGSLRVVPGDARLRLQEVSDGSYDLLVLDAFNSDAIPLHLLTLEAFQLYFRKLKPHGILAVHASNRYLDLSTVLANAGAAVGAVARQRSDLRITASESANRITASIWIVLARSRDDLGAVQRDDRWFVLQPRRERVWTDDYSNVWRAWKR